jgi:hypothetical protein
MTASSAANTYSGSSEKLIVVQSDATSEQAPVIHRERDNNK